MESSINDHRKLIALLNIRDEDLVEKFVREHTKESFIHILERLDEEDMASNDGRGITVAEYGS